VTGVKRQRRIVARSLALISCAMLFALSIPAVAQQPKKVPLIGYLSPRSAASGLRGVEAFRQGLHELGYIAGENILIEWRRAEGKLDRLDQLAAGLVALKINVFVTSGNAATRAAQLATGTIPIVTAIVSDPIENGFVASLNRPGGNVTGLATVGSETIEKQLKILREVVPHISRVEILWSPANPRGPGNLKETFGPPLRLKTVSRVVTGPDDIETAFQLANKKHADAIVIDGGGFFAFYRKQIIELAAKSRLPTMYANTAYVEAGGLMTYTPDLNAQYRRAATYVDKILKGAKPGDLPVEQPKKFELVINLKAAKQLGLTIPQSVLYRADKVIK